MHKVTSGLLNDQYGLEWISGKFALLWISQVFTQISEEIINLSLTVFVFELFGTGAALGTFFFVRALPPVLLSPMAGVFVDRFNRRTVSMISAFTSAVAAVVIPAAHEGLSILIDVFFIATINAVATPALYAALPQVVDKDRLLPANSAISATESIARFIAPALSATVVGMLGTSAGFFVAAAAYILAGCALIPLKLAEPVKDTEATRLTVKIV